MSLGLTNRKDSARGMTLALSFCILLIFYGSLSTSVDE